MPAPAVLIEPVEARLLLSAVHHAHAHSKVPKTAVAATVNSLTAHPVAQAERVGTTAAKGTTATKGNAGAKKTGRKAKAAVTANGIAGGTVPEGLTPASMRAAYGLGASSSAVAYPVTFNGVAGNGSGQTIAIVDCYDDPNAITDLAHFSAYFGLPGAPSFQVLNEYGGTTRPATDPAGANSQSGTWEEEESLDIEWAHAIAPQANLILYEASSASFADLYQAIYTAENNSAVTVVSMSFGAPEFNGEASENYYFTTPAGHGGGVTFLASTGDSGAGVASPSSAPSVVAVGGTSLTQTASGTYASESAWSGSGGGISAGESQPSYQAGTASAYSTTQRTVPDVAIDADPYTGVPIYDSYDFGATTPWLGNGYVEGGTSLACPMWAGIVAIADQGRAAEGLPSLASDAYTESGTLTRLYQLPATDFHDVTTGSDGAYSAGPGYDLTTGRGSPVASTLIDDLAGTADVTGRVFTDANGNGAYDAGTDAPLAGQTVYLDLNNDGHQDNGEPSTVTATNGTYSFTDVPAGGTVRLANGTPVGYQAVATGASAVVAYGATDTVNFALFPTTYAGAHYTLRTTTDGTVDQVLLNGTVVDSIAKSSLAAGLTFDLAGAGAGLTVNGANGNPLPAGGVAVVGATGAGDTLAILGTPGDGALSATATSVTFGGVPITFANIGSVSIDPGAGTDTLALSGDATVTVPAPAAGTGVLARTFASLSVSAGSKLSFSTAAASTDRQLIVTSALADAGTIDLGGNDMIVHNGSLAALTALAAAGYDGGRWAGAGLASSAAAADAARQTALGVIQNGSGASPIYTTFDNQSVSATDVLVKYTRYGDANLDGVVNASDFIRVDAGFALGQAGWVNGDFNYDGVVDGSDYSLMDNAYNQATTPV